MQFKLWNLEHAWQPVWCSCKISYDQLQIDVPHRYPTHVKGCSITGDVAKTLVSYSLQLQVTRAACCWWFSAFPHTIMMEYFWAWVLKKVHRPHWPVHFQTFQAFLWALQCYMLHILVLQMNTKCHFLLTVVKSSPVWKKLCNSVGLGIEANCLLVLRLFRNIGFRTGQG